MLEVVDLLYKVRPFKDKTDTNFVSNNSLFANFINSKTSLSEVHVFLDCKTESAFFVVINASFSNKQHKHTVWELTFLDNRFTSVINFLFKMLAYISHCDSIILIEKWDLCLQIHPEIKFFLLSLITYFGLDHLSHFVRIILKEALEP